MAWNNKPLQLIGKRFGMLTVCERIVNDRHNKTRWRCLCDCGKESLVTGRSLIVGNTISCGCYMKSRRLDGFNFRHGGSRKDAWTPEYRSYKAMLNRCSNNRSKQFYLYGGRGILVCERWKEGFGNFLFDMGERPSPKHSLDRINVNGNYEPNNCRWATPIQQARNQRTNRIVSAFGKSLCVAEWSEISGINESAIRRRIRDGWHPEKAVSEAVRPRSY